MFIVLQGSVSLILAEFATIEPRAKATCMRGLEEFVTNECTGVYKSQVVSASSICGGRDCDLPWPDETNVMTLAYSAIIFCEQPLTTEEEKA